MLSIFGGLFVLLSCLLLPIVLATNRKRRILRPVPGPEETFLVGHVRHFVNKTPSVIWKTVLRGFRECGKVFKMHLLNETLVFVSDPKIIEVMLSSPTMITKSAEYRLLENWLGEGLLLSSGKKWQARRKVITPAFHFKILEDFVEIFEKNATILVEKLATYSPTESVNVFPLISLAALDIICETSMGTLVHAQLNSKSVYAEAVKELSYVLHLRMFDVLLRNHLTFPFTKAARRERRALKVVHDASNSVIVSRRKALLENKSTDTNDGEQEEGTKKKQAFLDILLQSTVDGQPLTNTDIREEVDTFMFEGHDTTTSGISFALFCIAQHPEVQQKIVQEIQEVLGQDKDTPVTLQLLNQLHYLDIVLKEVLRLYPSVPLIGRLVEEDIVINNVKFPRGVNMVLSSFAMQRDADVLPEPERFHPERFLEKAQGGMGNAYTFIPFSAGPRNCIGQKFAMLEMKSLVSKILQHFEISIDGSYTEPELIAEIVLKCVNGIHLNFKPRH